MSIPIWLQNTVECDFRRVRTVNTNQSPFSGDVWQSQQPDTRWVARITYARMSRDEAAPLLAAIDNQQDGMGTMFLFDPDFAVPRSGFAGMGVLSAVPGFLAKQLPTSGWPPNTVLALENDKVHIAFAPLQFRMCTINTNVLSDASGNALLPIDEAPPGLSAGGAVFFAPIGRGGLPMRLVRHDRQSFPGGDFVVSIEAEERV
jgi:hypothetical protein